MHLVAARDERVDEVRADETGASGDAARTRRIVGDACSSPSRDRRLGQDHPGGAARRVAARARAARSSRAASPAARRSARRSATSSSHGLEMTAVGRGDAVRRRAGRARRAGDPAGARPRRVRSSATATSTRRSSTRASRAGSASSEVLELNLTVTGGLLPETDVRARARRRRTPAAAQERRASTGSSARTRRSRSVVADGYRSSPRSSRSAIVAAGRRRGPRRDRGAGCVTQRSRLLASSARPSACSRRRSPRGRCTRISSTGRPASASGSSPRAFARELLGTTPLARRIRTSTSSTRSAR